jgi:DNA-binding GntR family transcriptional regulator
LPTSRRPAHPSQPDSDGTLPASAVERVYRHTRTAILMGDYPPGFSLRMSELARLNGVSTIPVREAMRRLEAERLVESVANKGVRVARLSSTDLADAYQLRTILEAEAVRLTAGRLTDADRERSLRLRDEMAERFAAGDEAGAHAAHRALHFVVYERTNSPWLVHTISTLWDHTERYRRLGMKWLQQPESQAAQHDEVIEALFGGNVDAAVEALRAHFETSRRFLNQQAESDV